MFVLALVLIFSIPCLCQQYTNFYSYTSQFLFNDTDAQAAFVTSYLDNTAKIVYLVTPLTLMQYDLVAESYTASRPDPTFITSLHSVIFNSFRNEIWVATRDVPPSIGRFSARDNSLISTGINGAANPQPILALTQVVAATVNGGYGYFLNQRPPVALLRWNLTNDDLSVFESLPLGNYTPTTMQVDPATSTFYIGTAEGNSLVIRLNSTSFASSKISSYQLFVNSGDNFEDIAASVIDTVHGAVYYFTRGGTNGTENLPSKVAKQNFADVTSITKAVLGPEDVSVGSAVIDEVGGLAYISFFTRSPGRVAQLSLPTLLTETTQVVSPDVDKIVSGIGFWYNGQVVFSSIQPLKGNAPTLVFINPAMPCIENCNGNGVCDFRQCQCGNGTSTKTGASLPYQLPSCKYLFCDFNCFNNGNCSAVGTCQCSARWTGTFCNTPRCPNDCTSPEKGFCNYNNVTDINNTVTVVPLNCTCAAKWTGDDCSQAIPEPVVPCIARTNCSDCLSIPECGWCQSSGQCHWGDLVGPQLYNSSYADLMNITDNPYLTCKDYYYDSCPNVGYLIVNSIFTIIILFMWLVNIITVVIEDTAPEPHSRRDEWYRFMRSTKGHLVLYHMQFIASLGFVGQIFPSVLYSFTRWWNWTLLAIPLPWATEGVTTSRTLMNIDQFYVFSLINNKDEMLSIVLIWFGGFMAVSLFLYFLSTIVAFIRGKDVDKTIEAVKGRIVYVFFRVIDLSYYGLVFMSALAVANSKGTYFGIGILVWIVIGVIYPLAVFVFMVTQEQKRYFLDNVFSRRFQVFWGQYDMNKLPKISLLFYLPRLVIASAVGFGTNTPLAQLIIPLIVFIALIPITIVVKPYRDYIHDIAVIFIYVTDIVCIFVLFASFGSGSKLGIGVAFSVFAAIGIIAGFVMFVISWFHMNEIYSMAQCLKCQGGKRKEAGSSE